MRKPWEDGGSHRDFGGERPRRMDRRRDDRASFDRGDRREGGFGRRDGGFGRSEDRRFDRSERSDRFGGNRFGGDRDGNRFERRERDGERRFGGRRPSFAARRDDRQDKVFGVRSGPRARAATLNRRESTRAYDATNATRNALITLDADVARVFGTSESVNAALRHLIALAQLMGPAALVQATKEETVTEEVAAQQTEDEASEEDVVEEVETETAETIDAEVENEEDEEEEWFDIPSEEETK